MTRIERYLESAILKHAERGREVMQFGHTVRIWALEANHHDNVALAVSSCLSLVPGLMKAAPGTAA